MTGLLLVGGIGFEPMTSCVKKRSPTELAARGRNHSTHLVRSDDVATPLAERHCAVCARAPDAALGQIDRLLEQLPGWTVVNRKAISS